MLTSDPIYKKPYKPKIEILDLINPVLASPLYTYDAWTDSGTNNKPVSMSVALSENNWGTFVIQIEDNDLDLDTYDIASGARVKISAGKQASQMTQLVSGLIRKTGYSRGANSEVLFNIYGSTTGIRLNESIIYMVQEASHQAFDGQTLNLADTAMVARALLKTGLASLTTEGIITAQTLDADSDVQTVIPSVSIEYGEAMDLVNLVEDATGGNVAIEMAAAGLIPDKIHLRHEIRLPVGGRGFTVKNEPPNISLANDDADDTCYLRGKSWSFEESAYKADAYSSRLYSILPAESDPVLEDVSAWQQPGTPPGEVAQLFQPGHSHFIAGDIFLAIRQRADDGTARPMTFRIAGPDVAGVPTSLNVIANLKLNKPGVSFPTSTLFSDISMTNEYVMTDSSSTVIDSFNLDTNKKYWLILAQTEWHTGTFPIYYAVSTRRTSLTGATKYSTPNAGESSDSVSSGGLSGWGAATDTHPMWFEMPRRRAHSIVMWDPKAIGALGGSPGFSGKAISSVLQVAPSYIRTRQAWFKWMAYQLYYMARPRSNFSMPKVSAPNVPILPGDPIIINDAVLGLSDAGNDLVVTRCGDMTYSWSSFGGKGDSSAPPVLTLNPVGQPMRYK